MTANRTLSLLTPIAATISALQVRQSRRFFELVVHLAQREVGATYRFTALGVGWPLLRMLAQWGVLVFVFTKLVNVKIPDYPLFVLIGIVTWTWFSTGVLTGTSSVVTKRYLVFQPRLPNAVLPPVSVAVALLDLLIAMPIVLAVLLSTTSAHWSILFVPVLIAVQFVLMTGIVWLTSAANVYLRDVHGLVEVVVAMLFYVTPVFYDVHRISGSIRQFLYINPMVTLVDGWREVLVDGRLPTAGRLLAVAAASCAIAALGYVVFRRLERNFADEL
jgi:ABC-type polysaccharide/polyol phosphate export permease